MQEEDHMSKNFYSNNEDIPSIQVSPSAMQSKTRTPNFTKSSIKPDNKQSKCDDELKKRIESITERYINPNVPRYMSPTIVAKKKLDMRKKGVMDNADRSNFDQELRRPNGNGSFYSP